MPRLDVLVVGGGPAGLAAAIAARRKGFRVVLADRAGPPIDKACGEGLLPDALSALSRLGITFPPETGAYFHGITFVAGDKRLQSSFPGASALGVRRNVLHQLLVQVAIDAGVELLWNCKRIELNDGWVQIDGFNFQPEFLIGADGQNSSVRKYAGLEGKWYESHRYGFRRHFKVRPWSDQLEIYWYAGLQIYVTPVARSEVCIAVLTSDRRMRVERALAECQPLRSRLAHSLALTREMGSVTVRRRLRRVCTSRVALVGDAAGSVDAITGSGLATAFRCAIAVGDCLASGDLKSYQKRHEELTRRSRLMCRVLMVLANHDQLRYRAFVALVRRPELFGQLVGIHIDQISITEVNWYNFLGLGFCR
jgi:flavin-dependent dehydrogenase